MKDDRWKRMVIVAVVMALIAAVIVGLYAHARLCYENRGYALEGCPT